jgi:integrase
LEQHCQDGKRLSDLSDKSHNRTRHQVFAPHEYETKGPKKEMRNYGNGRVFLRGRIYHVAYCRNGHEFSESAKTTDENKAKKFLAKRLAESQKRDFVGPSEKRLTLDDLEAAIEADYVRHNRRSFDTVKFCLKRVREYFPHDRLLQIADRVEEYQNYRLNECKTPRSTINRHSAYLRRGFRLLYEAKKINTVPVIKLLEGENVREGFLGVADFAATLADIKDEDTRDIVAFVYNSGWRSGEGKKLEWDRVNTTDIDWALTLPRKNSKNKKPRTLVLVGELREIIERRLAKRRPDCPYVFHRDGRPIKSFRTAFKSAAKRVGLEGIIPHDMRRSAVRNLRRAGNDERDCMEITGHKTRAVFDRYDIIDEDDQRRALERQEQYKKEQLEQGRKVVPIKKAG